MSINTHSENGTLTITRVFNAPRKAVFEAWIETSKVQQWWGCAQTTNVQSDIEPKIGGKYCHVMTIEGVGDYPMDCRITEYDPPKRLAYKDVGDENNPNPMTVTVDFIERDNQTEVQLVHRNLPTEISDIVKGGWTAAFGKLATFLDSELAGSN